MPTTEREAARIAQRFQVVLDLYDLGVRMMREKLRRQHPRADDDEIDALVARWLLHRPGAPHGDGQGRPVEWPRREP